MRPILHCLAVALLFSLLLVAPSAPGHAQRSATKDWSNTVTLGANGVFVLGNPSAPTKLVEYFSYTCSHCANFHAQGMPALKSQWVRRGLVSLEFRNFVRDPFDLTAALLARCGGAARFLGNHEAILGNYDAWIARARTVGQPPAGADRAAQLAAIAEGTGLTAQLAERGLTPAAQRKCLADEQSLNQVLALTESAQKTPDFSGTPFFIVNGKSLANVHDWASLEPLLPALPRSRN